MPTAVPFQTEDSILCWELESSRRTAPAAGTWRSFGRISEWEDIGPEHAVFREPVAGAGREAHSIGVEGKAYRGNIGPFQVVDPLILATWWGQEVSLPTALGGGYYRHTATPTTNGQLASYAVQMRDRTLLTSAPLTDKNTYLETVTNRLALRGEAPQDDGSGGRCMAALGVLAHSDDPSVADKNVTLPTSDPYRFHHGTITLWGEPVLRVLDWEFEADNQGTPDYYWTSTYGRGPAETSPGAPVYGFRCSVVADGESFTAGSVTGTVKDILRGATPANGSVLMRRTANQDEFQVNLTDVLLQGAPKRRIPNGKVVYQCRGVVRASTFQWVDQTSTRLLPA